MFCEELFVNKGHYGQNYFCPAQIVRSGACALTVYNNPGSTDPFRLENYVNNIIDKGAIEL